MGFDNHYMTDHAYFIAGGRTLDIIKQYESDRENEDSLLQNIADEYGAVWVNQFGDFAFDTPPDNPLFEKRDLNWSKPLYSVNRDHPEASDLLERLADIPSQVQLTVDTIFAKRLTGQDYIATNPDKLFDSIYTKSHTEGHYGADHETVAATYEKCGDTYFVRVPRRVKGLFNSAAQNDNMLESYRFEWFTPPDSNPVSFSRVVELREAQLGDQTTARTVQESVGFFPQR